MTRIILTVTVFVLISLTFGCVKKVDNSTSPNSHDSEQVQEKDTSHDAAGGNPINEKASDAVEDTAAASDTKRKQEDYLHIGFKLMEKETLGNLKLGMTDKAVIIGLGEAEEKSRIITWGADGLDHQTWKYKTKGLKLDMVGKKNAQKVNIIKIVSPCSYKTTRGISIGSTRQQVLEKYRDEINTEYSDSAFLVAGTVYGGVMFELEDDKVISIFIGAGAE